MLPALPVRPASDRRPAWRRWSRSLRCRRGGGGPTPSARSGRARNAGTTGNGPQPRAAGSARRPVSGPTGYSRCTLFPRGRKGPDLSELGSGWTAPPTSRPEALSPQPAKQPPEAFLSKSSIMLEMRGEQKRLPPPYYNNFGTTVPDPNSTLDRPVPPGTMQVWKKDRRTNRRSECAAKPRFLRLCSTLGPARSVTTPGIRVSVALPPVLPDQCPSRTRLRSVAARAPAAGPEASWSL